MSLTALVGCGGDKLSLDRVKSDPIGAISDAANVASTALEKKSAFVSAMKKLSEADTLGFELSASADEYASLSLSGNSSKSKGLASGKVSLMIDGASSDTYFWSDKSGFALKSPELIGDETYGVNMETLDSDLKNSTLLESMGVDTDKIAGSADTALSVEALRQAFEQLKSDVTATANGSAQVEEEAITIASGEVNAVSVKLPVNKDACGAYFDAVIKFCDKISEGAVDRDAVASAKDEIAEKLEGADVFAKVYLSKKTATAVKSELLIEADGIKMSMTNAKVKDDAASIDTDIAVTVVENGETVTVNGEIRTVTEKGQEGITYKVSVPDIGGSGAGDITVSAVRNTADGKIELKAGGKFGGAEMNYSVTGTLTYSNTECILTLDPIDIPDVCKVNASLKMTTGAEPEAVPAYKNVLMLDEDDFQSLLLEFASSEFVWKLDSIFNSNEAYDPDFDYDWDDSDFDWDDSDFDWDDSDFDWNDSDFDWGDSDLDWGNAGFDWGDLNPDDEK